MKIDADTLSELDLIEAVLEALKEQAPEGCLLCSFEAWDQQDWNQEDWGLNAESKG